MKNFTQELKNIMTEDPGVPIMSPDELRARSQTIVILTNSAPDELLALAGPDRKATLLSIDPPMITLPYQKGVFKVRPEDIVFENHHSGRDVTEAGAEETPYEKFFSQAMKKFGVSSPIELSPDDTKKFFNYVEKNWEAEKQKEKKRDSRLDGVPVTLPGLVRAQRLQEKAAYVGFDWEKIESVWEKVYEELQEIKLAQQENNKDSIEEEIGDTIFALVNLARFLGIPAEDALRKSNNKFINRFKMIEMELKKRGKTLEEASLDEMDEIWNAEKRKS